MARYLRHSSYTDGVFHLGVPRGMVMVEATMRKQRRRNAILPLKVTIVDGSAIHLAHTLDISASGARLVVTSQFAPGTQVFVEFKRRRAEGTVIWSKARNDSKYDHELGLQMRNAGSAFGESTCRCGKPMNVRRRVSRSAN